jgi:hypothetical protein
VDPEETHPKFTTMLVTPAPVPVAKPPEVIVTAPRFDEIQLT